MSLKNRLFGWRRGVEELLFPPRCCCCGVWSEEAGEGICGRCYESICSPNGPQCPICGQEFETMGASDHLCESCLRSPPPFNRVSALTYYEEPVRTLLHRLKYNYDTTVVRPLLKIARGCDISAHDSCNSIIPVPLHNRRLKQRGVNQAQLLARMLFPEKRRQISCDVLVKSKNTLSQAGLDKAARQSNLAGAFDVNIPECIENKNVCLVDDIYTTGTTVSECAGVLKKRGAAEVSVVVFARVRGGKREKRN